MYSGEISTFIENPFQKIHSQVEYLYQCRGKCQGGSWFFLKKVMSLGGVSVLRIEGSQSRIIGIGIAMVIGKISRDSSVSSSEMKFHRSLEETLQLKSFHQFITTLVNDALEPFFCLRFTTISNTFFLWLFNNVPVYTVKRRHQTFSNMKSFPRVTSVLNFSPGPRREMRDGGDQQQPALNYS